MISFKPGLKILRAPGLPTEPPKELPSIFTQAANFAGAIARTAVTVAKAEFPLVSSSQAEARYAICKTCEFFRAEDERCSHPGCGCFTRVKVWFKAERCPATPPKW